MIDVIVFEDACATFQEWEEFNEDVIKEYVGWDEITSEGDDQFTSIEWVNKDVASIPFCEGPHFIFIRT